MNLRQFPRLSWYAMLTLVALLLSACSPKFDWREVRGKDAPYVAVFPAKPSTFERSVNLDGLNVTMSMTAAEIDGVTFAVGTAETADAGQAQKALSAMKTALVNNISGSIKSEKPSASAGVTTIDLNALGHRSNGQKLRLTARFIAQDKRIYQVLVVGTESAISDDAVDTFLSGFKLNY